VVVWFCPPHGEQTPHVDQALLRPVATRFDTLVTPWSGPTVVGIRQPEPAAPGDVAADAAPAWSAAPAMVQADAAAMASPLMILRFDMRHPLRSSPQDLLPLTSRAPLEARDGAGVSPPGDQPSRLLRARILPRSLASSTVLRSRIAVGVTSAHSSSAQNSSACS